MTRRDLRRAGWSAVTVLVCAASSGSARADAGDVVLSEVLFRDGKELLGKGDYAKACPKLAESYRLDPATGTLLALAVCHERQGKLASAWGEYADAASRAKIEGRPDRAAAARAKVAELEPRLSTITLVLSDGPALAGLEVRRNGAVVAPAWLGTAVPVDGGTFTLEARAPANYRWGTQVEVSPSGDRVVVTIPAFPRGPAGVVRGSPAATRVPSPAPVASAPPGPSAIAPSGAALASAPAPAPSGAALVPAPAPSGAAAALGPSPGPEPPPLSAVEAPPHRTHRGLGALQWTGVGAAAAGVVGIGVGAGLGLRAAAKNRDSRANCSPVSPDLCNAQGRRDRSGAIADGDVATVAFIAGGVLAAAGITLVIAGKPHEAGAPTAAAPAAAAFLEAAPWVSADGAGAAISGRF